MTGHAEVIPVNPTELSERSDGISSLVTRVGQMSILGGWGRALNNVWLCALDNVNKFLLFGSRDLELVETGAEVYK
jgi:hypothetical protein